MAPHGRFPTEPLYPRVRKPIAGRGKGSIWCAAAGPFFEQGMHRERGAHQAMARTALFDLGIGEPFSRSGPTKSGRKREQQAVRFCSVGRAMGRGSNRGVQVLSQSRGAATAIEREHLQLAPGATVLRTTRLRGNGSRALMYETACLALDRLPGLETAEFGNYHILALARVCSVPLGPTQERVFRTSASVEVAAYLGVSQDTQLLALDRTIFALSGEPIEWRVALCNLGPAEIE